ncbi:MAG TPA: response regulator [Longimicrobiaceae bacterium]|nr:response regulator [Longimicrobiaceae bacterium]
MGKLSPAALRRFWSELKRRHVVRVGLVYIALGGGAIQLVTAVFPTLRVDERVTAAVVVLILLGFPLTLGLAWAFDVTPERPRLDEAAAAPPTPVRGVAVPARRIFPAARRPDVPVVAAPGPAESAPGPASAEEVRRAELATLRHELRTPLNAVLGYSEILLEEAEPGTGSPHLEALREIRASGRRLLAQIDELVRPAPDAAEAPGGPGLQDLRARARETLARPAGALANDCRAALEGARAAGASALLPDLERVAAAAGQLSEMVAAPSSTAASAQEQAGGHARTQEEAERVMVRLRPGTGVAGAPPRHGQLLVVDDNSLNRDLLSRQLAREGYSVDAAVDGGEALELLRAHAYDLVLLDVLMPGVDGVQVLERMRREPALATIPVIMISALDEMESVVHCIERGAVDYISKPFDPVLLRARIGTTLEVHRLRAQERRDAESLDAEAGWADRLARSLLPAAVAERVRGGVNRIAELHPELSVLAVELDGFGTLAERGGADAAVDRLAAAVDILDRATTERGVQSLWLGAGCFLAVAGPNAPRGDHAALVAELALEVSAALGPWRAGAEPLRSGIGIHVGAVSVGLTGEDRLVLGLWGEGVDLARRLGRASAPDEIWISPAAHAQLHGGFAFENRGVLQVSDRGRVPVYRLTGARAPAGRGSGS